MASRVRCDGGQMVSDGSSASAAFVPEAGGAVSADPSGGAGWVPSAAALGGVLRLAVPTGEEGPGIEPKGRRRRCDCQMEEATACEATAARRG